MVVAGPLQVIEQHIRGDVVGVPAVAGGDPFVAFMAGGPDALAQHPVVLQVVHGSRRVKAMTVCSTRYGRTPIPSHASTTPHRTTDINHAFRTSLLMRKGCWPRRAQRRFSRCHALVSEPSTVRGQKR